uniref:Rieske domain-containing protein n=1 Tax=viral metagenome TaxID=1070528 RepID=A0A6C0CRN2_9ZZZZ
MYYPLAFEKDLTLKPKVVTLKKQDFVLWKSYKDIVCMPDRCPHRHAKLSAGRIIDGNHIECPYHGWQFNAKGTCLKIPQLTNDKILKMCSIKAFDTKVWDGIVWASPMEATFPYPKKEYLNDDKYFVTDYYLDAPYSYYLQIENLLDPAHLHFVHDGFQGNRKKASPIRLKYFKETEKEIYGYFEHDNDDTPDISVRFIKPFMVDVSIYNKKSKKLLRKNIIFASPKDDKKCNVFFRDVAMKDTFLPKENGWLRFHGDIFLNGFSKNFVEDHYQFINNEIIDRIMTQDLDVLKGQQKNIPDYLKARYVMPAECDRMIIAFRKWAKNFKI